MSRHTYIPAILLLLALGIVAIVKAQEWSYHAKQGDRPTAASRPNALRQPKTFAAEKPELVQSQTSFLQAEPARIQPEAAVSLPSRQTNNFQPQPAASQPWETTEQPQETIAQQADTPGWMQNRFVVEQPSAQANTADHVTPVEGNSIAPRQFAQVGAEAASNQSAAIDQPASSRRSFTAPQQSAATPATETPRIARHLERPALPAQETTTDQNLLLQTTSPALVAQVAGPPTIIVGKAADYNVQISNLGSVAAEDVAVLVDVPVWAEVSGAQATIGSARFEPIVDEVSRLKWGVFSLEGGKSETLTLKIVPRQSRSFDLAVQIVQKPPGQLAQIDVQQPKLEMALSGPQEVLYGETKTYTITVSNPGTGPAENVVVNLLPIAPGQDTAGVSKLGTIEAGGRQVIEFDLNARQAGDLQLRAAAFADGGLSNEATLGVHVRRAFLETAAAGPEIKYAGTTATYQFRVANTGDAMAENVIAEAILPRSAQFVSATESGRWQENGRVQWSIGSLRAGAARVFELQCELSEAGSNRLEAIATADGKLTSGTHCITQVEALADLKLIVNDPQGPLPLDEPTVYEVRVVNRGTKAAEGVQIAGFFSEGLEPVSVEGGAAEIGVGQVIFQPIGRIVAGQELVFKIIAKATGAGNHTFRADVVCTAPETKLAAQETTRFYGDVAVRQAANEPTPAEATLPPLRR